MEPSLLFFATCFISVLAIVNPLSTIGVFLSLLRNDPPSERHKVAFRSSLAAFCVLIFFAITGYFVFQIYSISVEAFRIAGGLVLFYIGMRMLFPPAGEEHRHVPGAQVYLVPLAIPLTSGPGAITTVVVLASQAQNFWLELALWAAIFSACAVNYFVLRHSDVIVRKLGHTGVSSLVKIMGLLVCAVGVQFVITGLKAAFPLLAGA